MPTTSVQPLLRNRLATADSLYLRQHADNPVAWQTWGDAAWDLAGKLDRPIFLSIGYSTCHWCHVMARESFSDPAVAALLNEHFIPVKVDREERPDVDRIHMAYVQAAVGQGGWPLSVWLTPKLQPFFGGTYFPPNDRWGRPGFPTVLRQLAEAWQSRRTELLTAASNSLEMLRTHAADSAPPALPAPLSAALELAQTRFTAQWDRIHGGFGSAPKFPRPVVLSLLFRLLARNQNSNTELAAMVASTLAGMARGGMCDQLGGGFHRYSVDAAWRVPHFEKMLYDQAQLVCAYLEGYQATNSAEWAQVARETLAYMGRDLQSQDGGYYAAEDADSALPDNPEEHSEGAFYVWSAAEFAAACGTDALWAAEHCGVHPAGNIPAGADPHGELHGRNVLRRSASETSPAKAQRFDSIRQRLLAARQCRPRPGRDEKLVAAWNGYALSALSRAAQVLDDPHWLATGVRAARFLKLHLTDDTGRLHRSWNNGRAGNEGFAEDYAAVIAGLIDLHEAGGGREWLEWAASLQQIMDTRFADTASGGYFATATDDPSIMLRLKDEYDGAEPSACSLAALNLLRLSALLGRDEWKGQAEATLAWAQERLGTAPEMMPQMLVAADFTSSPVRRIVLIGRRQDPALRRLAAAIHRRLELPRVILRIEGAADLAWFARSQPWLADLPIEGPPSAMVCTQAACQPPITDPEQLASVLAS
jgi:uncharacterized protein YyaL (SSP411 family)